MVSNASPLIYLSMVGNLHLLRNLFNEILIPDEVFREVCGKGGTPDSIVISSAVDEGWIHTKDVVSGDIDSLAKSSGIDLGEAAAIILAREAGALLLIDDKMGRTTAEILGVRCLGTVGVLLRALFTSTIDFNEYVEILDRMIDAGFRLDSKVYRLAVRIAKDFDEK